MNLATGRVSVVMPVFNGARFLKEACDSVMRQEHLRELIVVDDGSTDGSSSIAAALGPPVVVESIVHSGIAVARNHGVARASGEFLAFIDADDVVPPDRFAIQVRHLTADPGLAAVFGSLDEFVSETSAAGLRRAKTGAATRLPSTMLVRRAAFDEVGPFDRGAGAAVGVDWTARFLASSLRWRTHDDVVLHRRLHAGSNGMVDRSRRAAFARTVKATLDRKRRAV